LLSPSAGQLLFSATLSRFGFHIGASLGFTLLNDPPPLDQPFFGVADDIAPARTGHAKRQVFGNGPCRESQKLGEFGNRSGNQFGRFLGHRFAFLADEVEPEVLVLRA
jgi:hypothetical protein